MSEYHKIQSIYLRDPATKHHTFLEGRFTLPEFEYLAGDDWRWDEKIDGTNVRVYWTPGERVIYKGRTDNAQMPTFLIEKLLDVFTPESFERSFPDCGAPVVLYGEGYGAKIQKGGGDYIPDGVGFCLFDAMVGGMLLRRDSVEDIAEKFGVPAAPVLRIGTLSEAVEAVRAGFPSKIAQKPRTAEGLVLRPLVDLFDRRGARIITKIKHKDFA